jgi:hypothetical protein
MKSYLQANRFPLLTLLALIVAFLISPEYAAAIAPVAGVVLGVANTKSTEVTNADATPQVKSDIAISHGRLHEKVATVEIAAADDAGSVYRMCRLHSSWRISEITVFCDAITSGAAYDCGLYKTAEDGGAAVDDNAYADAFTLVSGILVGTQLLFEGGSAKGIEKIEQRVYQDAGLSTDPNIWYDLCLTGDTPGSGAGTVSLRVRYVAND